MYEWNGSVWDWRQIPEIDAGDCAYDGDGKLTLNFAYVQHWLVSWRINTPTTNHQCSPYVRHLISLAVIYQNIARRNNNVTICSREIGYHTNALQYIYTLKNASNITCQLSSTVLYTDIFFNNMIKLTRITEIFFLYVFLLKGLWLWHPIFLNDRVRSDQHIPVNQSPRAGGRVNIGQLKVCFTGKGLVIVQGL